MLATKRKSKTTETETKQKQQQTVIVNVLTKKRSSTKKIKPRCSSVPLMQ
jgi:hypothetical protein